MLTGWQKIGGAWYYMNSSGAMKTGWLELSKGWYYLNSSGAMQTGWEKIGGKWYYLDPSKDGLMVENTMKTIGGELYSFASSGAMRSNCLIKLEDNACGYANSSGAITKIGVYSGSNVILKSSSGKTLTGWQKFDGTWFYASSKGVVQKGWLKLSGKWYYLDSKTGAMATGWKTIDGKSYYFNGSGVWIDGGQMAIKAQGYSSGTKYLILVDRGKHTVGVFQGSKNNWSLKYSWKCVTGAPGSPTITGTFHTTGGKRGSLSTDSRAIYCTQIWGGYFFHSILASESELGKSLSHGCIRLPYSAAKWIYSNVKGGTTVVIYN